MKQIPKRFRKLALLTIAITALSGCAAVDSMNAAQKRWEATHEYGSAEGLAQANAIYQSRLALEQQTRAQQGGNAALSTTTCRKVGQSIMCQKVGN